jgi:hypothetical protein
VDDFVVSLNKETKRDETGKSIQSRHSHKRTALLVFRPTTTIPQSAVRIVVPKLAQPTFNDAYGATNIPSSRGSWLARVSHRASHIPNRPSFSGPRLLPLRTPASATFATPPLERLLPVAHKRASYPASPVSPAETEFADTPLDTSPAGKERDRGGDRDRLAGEQRPATSDTVLLPSTALPQIRHPRRATLTQDSAKELTMDKYARHAGDHTYDSDAEADDEFERSVFTSPIIAGHFQDDNSDHPSDSEDDHSIDGGDDTPTTQGWADREGRSPTGAITQWTEEEAADYIAALSPALKQYGLRFVEEGVNGEALAALHHDELRELGVASVGHRLTILKAVYEQKMRAGMRIEDGDYVPLSAEGEKGDLNATQDDISRVIDSIRLRDQRIMSTEAELRVLKQDLERVSEENKKLREETLPIVRMMKDQRTPLPDPAGGTIPSPREVDAVRQAENMGSQSKGSSLSRKFSTKKLFLKSDPSKQHSPTHGSQSHTPQPREVREDGGAHLEASAAAMAASTHLSATMASQHSPNSVHGQQLSPTSPAYSMHSSGAASQQYHPPSSAASRSFPREVNTSRHEQRAYGHNTDDQWNQKDPRQQQDRSRRQAPTPSPREDETPNAGRDRYAILSHSPLVSFLTLPTLRDNPQVEIFKSFRVSIDDPCHVVLPVVSPSPQQQHRQHRRELNSISDVIRQALKRYNITDDWRQYALYIVHGDQERCLGLEEKPLLLFKQLDKEGRKPMFMLRRHASPQEGWSGTTNPANMPREHQEAAKVC